MAVHAGWQRRIHFAAETTWGTTPGSPAYIYLPYSSYSVIATPQSVQAGLFTGHRQRRHNRVNRYTVQGQVQTPLWGYQVDDGVNTQSIAQRLIAPALSAPAGLELDALLFEIFENDTENKRHNGLRINNLTLAGDSQSNIITLTLDLIGKSETGGITEQSLSATLPQPVEFLFSDSTFAYAGSAIELESFQITVNNNLQPRWGNASTISYLTNGERHVNYQFSVVKTANTWDALRRSTAVNNATAQLVLKGLHGGTAANNYTTVTIDFDRVNFMNASDNGDLNALWSQSPEFVVLKPDTTDNEIDVTYGTAA